VATTYYAPDPIQSMQFIPGGIVPANGGQLFFYAAGTSTKTTVYKDNAGAVTWSNPIVLDSGGNLPSGGEVWFQSGITYKVVFAPSNDTDPPTSPYWTKDNLAGMNDVNNTISALEWVVGTTPTFISTTSFSLVGDLTSTYTAGRRIKTTNTGGTIYSTVISSAYGGVTTVVTVANDSGVLDSGMTDVSYGLLNPVNPSISQAEINRKSTAIASDGSGTTNIWGITGDFVHITGTNTIRHFSTASYAGAIRTVIFDSGLQLMSSAAFQIPGSSNLFTAAGDRAIVRADTVSTSIMIMYTRASAQQSRTVLTTVTTGAVYITPVAAQRLLVRLVGGGGGGGAAGAGLNGSSTTFGTLTGSGGAPGQIGGPGGGGGAASGGDINISGGSGSGGVTVGGGRIDAGSVGGSSALGGGGGGGSGSAGPSNASSGAVGSGGGGGGGACTATGTAGGGGGAGGYVEKLIVGPVSSYAYTVGAGGSNGSGSAQISPGGVGGSGIIIVDEYYY